MIPFVHFCCSSSCRMMISFVHNFSCNSSCAGCFLLCYFCCNRFNPLSAIFFLQQLLQVQFLLCNFFLQENVGGKSSCFQCEAHDSSEVKTSSMEFFGVYFSSKNRGHINMLLPFCFFCDVSQLLSIHPCVWDLEMAVTKLC